MISLLGATGGGWQAVGSGVGHFALQLASARRSGSAAGGPLLQLMRRVPLPNAALYPVQTIAFAILLYGVTTAAEGSGYLAVFLAGILVGDERAPYKREIEHFAGALASLAEIAAFVVLGPVGRPRAARSRLDGVAGPRARRRCSSSSSGRCSSGWCCCRVDLTGGERRFVLFAGLKGAVPILLGTYVLAEHAAHAQQIYDVIFVVVLVSVVRAGRPRAARGPPAARADAGRRARAVGAGHALPRRAARAAPLRRRARAHRPTGARSASWTSARTSGSAW